MFKKLFKKKLTPGICPYCGYTLAYNAKFCGKCGYKSPFYDKTINTERKSMPCPECGENVNVSDKHCRKCNWYNIVYKGVSIKHPPKAEDGFRYCYFCQNYVEPVRYCSICGVRESVLDFID